jgi:hypothetical protein
VFDGGVWPDGEDGRPPGCEVTGQIVVDTAIIEVTTVVERGGQFVTSGPQLVIVTSIVL